MNPVNRQTAMTTRSPWLVNLVGYLLILVVYLRRTNDLSPPFSLTWLIGLIALFTVLYASSDRIVRVCRGYPWIYLAIQTCLVQALGFFEAHQDTWALLYVVLAFQAARFLRRGAAFVWFSLFSCSLLLTLFLDYGLLSGLGRAAAYGIIGFVLVSYDVQYAQRLDALTESQLLLDELQAAHDQLDRYANQIAAVAARTQRDQMIQVLYDSVGHQVLEIQHDLITARMLLPANPSQARGRINLLQEKIQAALNQMRHLIEVWRTDP